MSEKLFNIVFKGEIVAGADESAVKANVAKLFKANEQVLARLFSGEPIAIKKNVDKAGAMKYRALMKKAGAICYAQDPAEPMTPAAKPAINPVSEQATKVSSAVVDEKQSKDSTGEDAQWTLAEPGALIGELKQQQEVSIPDTSSMTIAPVGADVLEHPPEIEIADLPDISSIDLAPVGADVADPVESVAVAIPDTDGIDLAPVGADVADPVEHDAPPPPDVSSITIAPVGADVADPEPEKPEPKVDISHISLE